MSRFRVLFALAVVGLAAAAVLMMAACGGDDEDLSTRYHGFSAAPAYSMPAFTLTDTAGKPFDLAKETKGRVTLLYVGYTHCPDICPTHYYEITQALATLNKKVREQVRVVFITADPARDTGEVMRDWLDLFDPTYVGLRAADARELVAVLRALNMPPPQRTDLGEGYYSVSHAAFVIAFTKDGTGRLVYPSGMTAEDWSHDLPLLVKEDWR